MLFYFLSKFIEAIHRTGHKPVSLLVSLLVSVLHSDKRAGLRQEEHPAENLCQIRHADTKTTDEVHRWSDGGDAECWCDRGRRLGQGEMEAEDELISNAGF